MVSGQDAVPAREPVVRLLPAGQSLEAPITIAYRFSGVAAGVSPTINVFYTDHASSALSGIVANIRNRVEVIKR